MQVSRLHCGIYFSLATVGTNSFVSEVASLGLHPNGRVKPSEEIPLRNPQRAQYHPSTGITGAVLAASAAPVLANIWGDNDVLYWFASDAPVVANQYGFSTRPNYANTGPRLVCQCWYFDIGAQYAVLKLKCNQYRACTGQPTAASHYRCSTAPVERHEASKQSMNDRSIAVPHYSRSPAE
ncbi:hypothetical protein DBV15_05668, partial [Temnothorax longispinosus]